MADTKRASPSRRRRNTGSSGNKSSGNSSSGNGRVSAAEIAKSAKRQLAEITGRTPEGVLGVRRCDDGWEVVVEIVELSRIPSTTDVLGSYEVRVDDSGDVLEYRRTRRYHRNQPDEE